MPNAKSQYYSKRDFRALFTGDNMPQLLYVSRVRPPDQAHPRIIHAHKDLVEVLLICGGTGDFRIGESAYHVETGDVLVYNSGVVHEEISSRENALDIFCMGVGGLRMPDLRENALIPDQSPAVCRAGDEAGDLLSLYDMMYRCLREDRPGCEAFCHCLMLALLSRTIRLMGDMPQEPVVEKEPLGRKIQEYIDQHFMEPLTLQDIGKSLHLSPYYLSHVFKETIGYSPMQYLLRRRIGEAQNLLLTTDLSIARISEQVGYETQNYFNLQFSKYVGMPPKKFRQEFREKQVKTAEP